MTSPRKAPVISEEKGEKELAVNFGFSSLRENTVTLFGEREREKKKRLDSKLVLETACARTTPTTSGFPKTLIALIWLINECRIVRQGFLDAASLMCMCGGLIWSKISFLNCR